MSAFNYTKDRPTESTFSDIQSLNKFTEAVSREHVTFNLYYIQEIVILANSRIMFPKYLKSIKQDRK